MIAITIRLESDGKIFECFTPNISPEKIDIVIDEIKIVLKERLNNSIKENNDKNY